MATRPLSATIASVTGTSREGERMNVRDRMA